MLGLVPTVLVMYLTDKKFPYEAYVSGCWEAGYNEIKNLWQQGFPLQ